MPSSTSQTLVCPDVEYVGNDHAFLQPLVVTIFFSGPVPQHLVREQIQPIKISVSVAEEYNEFMAPVVRAKAWSVYQSEPSEHSVSLLRPVHYAGSDDICMATRAQDFVIPFLPLPRTFDWTDSQQWAMLSNEIKCWLIDEVQDSSSPHWTWGRDAFWLAFIGAYPSFPKGRWSAWDPRIPLEGTFITEWLSGDETDSVDHDMSSGSGSNDEQNEQKTGGSATPLDCSATVSYVWEMFSRHIALFFPQPLISTM